MTSLPAVCSTDVRAEALTDFREKTDRHRQGCVQKPRSRSSLWADHKLRCNSHVLRHLGCSLERLGAQPRKPYEWAATHHAEYYDSDGPATDIGNTDLYDRSNF